MTANNAGNGFSAMQLRPAWRRTEVPEFSHIKNNYAFGGFCRRNSCVCVSCQTAYAQVHILSQRRNSCVCVSCQLVVNLPHAHRVKSQFMRMCELPVCKTVCILGNVRRNSCVCVSCLPISIAQYTNTLSGQ